MTNDLGPPPKMVVVVITVVSSVVAVDAGIKAKAESSSDRQWHWS